MTMVSGEFVITLVTNIIIIARRVNLDAFLIAKMANVMHSEIIFALNNSIVSI